MSVYTVYVRDESGKKFCEEFVYESKDVCYYLLDFNVKEKCQGKNNCKIIVEKNGKIFATLDLENRKTFETLN